MQPKGYVCVTVNYRMLDEAPITACVEDVKNAVRWLRAHAEEYNIDPERIGATGNSAGAHLAVMLGVCPPSAGLEGDGPYQEYSSMVQAVVASATPTSFLSAMSDRQRERSNEQAARAPRKNELRMESEEVRAKASPVTYASADAPPILLVHSISDRTVGVFHSDKLGQAHCEKPVPKMSTIFSSATAVGMVLFSAILYLPNLSGNPFLIAY